MNNIRKYTLLIFTLISVYAGAQLNLNINIAYPAPGYLSDWAYGKSGMATLVLNQENQLLKIKFQTQLDKKETALLNFYFQPRTAKTFYTLYGDIFAYICAGITLTVFIFTLVFLNSKEYD